MNGAGDPRETAGVSDYQNGRMGESISIAMEFSKDDKGNTDGSVCKGGHGHGTWNVAFRSTSKGWAAEMVTWKV